MEVCFVLAVEVKEVEVVGVLLVAVHQIIRRTVAAVEVEALTLRIPTDAQLSDPVPKGHPPVILGRLPIWRRLVRRSNSRRTRSICYFSFEAFFGLGAAL